MRFRDRVDAGRQLGVALRHHAGRDDVLVLGLPRGGVPVAYEVARALAAPLDVFVVRKLGVPGHEELAMGAIASGGVRVLNRELVAQLRMPSEVLEAVVANEQLELVRREREYRGARAAPVIAGRTVLVVDDGLATGASMRAAIQALRPVRPARIVVAVPVGPADTCEQLRHEVDELVCVAQPVSFQGVGQWYEDFSQTSDAEVRELLVRAASEAQVAAFPSRQ